MRAYGIALALIAVALGVLGVQTCAFRARANELSSRVAAMRADADALGARVEAVRTAMTGRADTIARATDATGDRLDALGGRVRAIGDQLPVPAGAVCLERAVDAIEGGTAPHWTYACVVAPGRRVLAVDGTVTARAAGGDGAIVHVTCEACSRTAGAAPGPVDATWRGLGAVRLQAVVAPRARVLTGDVSVECPKLNEQCAAHLALRIQ